MRFAVPLILAYSRLEAKLYEKIHQGVSKTKSQLLIHHLLLLWYPNYHQLRSGAVSTGPSHPPGG